MNNRCWIVLVIGLLVIPALACGQDEREQPQATRTHSPTATPLLTVVPTPAWTVVPAAAPATPSPSTPTATSPAHGPSLTDVQFALDVDPTGQLTFPATQFVLGVTRVYVRFAYQGLGDVTEVKTVWYLHENPLSVGTLAWDGGDAGEYIIWIEDPDGLGRGHWRWELAAIGLEGGGEEDTLLGGGAFIIGGQPRYINSNWGLSFDPPSAWQIGSESPDYVTFSSPDQRKALALRVKQEVGGLPETSAANLEWFQEDLREAEVVATEEVTMNGEKALLQQARYTDQGNAEQILFVVSALHADTAYSLWMLGPADDLVTVRTELVAALHSIRFLSGE